jgi:hypothetical protein
VTIGVHPIKEGLSLDNPIFISSDLSSRAADTNTHGAICMKEEKRLLAPCSVVLQKIF